MNAWNNENFQMGMGAMMQQNAAMDNAPPAPRHPPPAAPLIGPVVPENVLGSQNETAEADSQADVSSSQIQRRQSSREHRDRERSSTDRNRRRSRSRDRRDRNDSHATRNRWDRRSRERRTKWSDDRDPVAMGGQHVPGMHMMMPGMMPFMNMMSQQPMEGQMSMMPSMNVMPNMMPMPNMMDQNMMMMNQQIIPNMPMVANQQICTSGGIFLAPIPGVSTPTRRDRPKGCRTIFVGGLPHNITEETLNEIFQRFGNVMEIKIPRRGVFYIRFERQESVEQSFSVSGYRFRFHDQVDNEATTMFIDYAMNREDQNEYDKNSHKRAPSPHRVEPYTPSALALVTDKIKSEDEFVNVAPTLATWLERGECNKKNANSFYSLVQASNNQIRRLFSEKMQLDDELSNMKTSIKDKFALVLKQFEQVAKILSAAKHQRVSDHFTKQQRRNIDMWMKMTEELENMKEEFNTTFEEDEVERPSKNMVTLEKYEELKRENENLTYELEGYKNEAYLAKDEAERKFETFKAHFIAQQALQNKQSYPAAMMTSIKKKNETITSMSEVWPTAPPPLPPPATPPTMMDDNKIIISGPTVPPSEAKLISMLTAFLMVHPLGASLDYLVSYVKSMTPNVTQATVLSTLEKYKDVFICKTTGVGANIEHRWSFITFDVIKTEM